MTKKRKEKKRKKERKKEEKLLRGNLRTLAMRRSFSAYVSSFKRKERQAGET